MMFQGSGSADAPVRHPIEAVRTSAPSPEIFAESERTRASALHDGGTICNLEHKGWHSRRYLLHLDVPDKIQFITFRTYGSFQPEEADLIRVGLDEGGIEWDAHVDASKVNRILSDENLASIVNETIVNGEALGHYELFAYSIMANHVHILIRPSDTKTIPQIVQGLKSVSSRRIMRLAGELDHVWAPDYFDRYMRDEEHVIATARYIEQNPMKVGLPNSYPFASRKYI